MDEMEKYQDIDTNKKKKNTSGVRQLKQMRLEKMWKTGLAQYTIIPLDTDRGILFTQVRIVDKNDEYAKKFQNPFLFEGKEIYYVVPSVALECSLEEYEALFYSLVRKFDHLLAHIKHAPAYSSINQFEKTRGGWEHNFNDYDALLPPLITAMPKRKHCVEIIESHGHSRVCGNVFSSTSNNQIRCPNCRLLYEINNTSAFHIKQNEKGWFWDYELAKWLTFIRHKKKLKYLSPTDLKYMRGYDRGGDRN